jgi:hypothetical protein
MKVIKNVKGIFLKACKTVFPKTKRPKERIDNEVRLTKESLKFHDELISVILSCK